jgi:hypothetical protein
MRIEGSLVVRARLHFRQPALGGQAERRVVGIRRQSCRLDVDRDRPVAGIGEHLNDNGRGRAVVGAARNLNPELLDERQRRSICGVAAQGGENGLAILPQELRNGWIGLFDLL